MKEFTLTEQVETGPRSLAEKLDYLFRTVRPQGREFTHQEVADGLRDEGGPTISATYVWQLRRGQRTNPRMSHLEALARFFDVAPAYFFDEAMSGRIAAELNMVAALREGGVQQVAQLAHGLSGDTLDVLVDLLERFRQLESLPDPV
jgi:transcriptional regulator with XRE-family HTH domain